MEYIQSGYRGLSLVVTLNWHRLLVLICIAIAFYAGGILAAKVALPS